MGWETLDDHLESISFAFALTAAVTVALLIICSRQSATTRAGGGLWILWAGLLLMAAREGLRVLRISGVWTPSAWANDAAKIVGAVGLILIVLGFQRILGTGRPRGTPLHDTVGLEAGPGGGPA